MFKGVVYTCYFDNKHRYSFNFSVVFLMGNDLFFLQGYYCSNIYNIT